jgi:hypothetical protein
MALSLFDCKLAGVFVAAAAACNAMTAVKKNKKGELEASERTNPSMPWGLAGRSVCCADNVAQEDSMDALWCGAKCGLVDEHVRDLLLNHR